MDCTEGDEPHEVGEQLVVARRDAAEVFEFVEEALDQIAFFVELPVAGMRSAAVGPGWDDGLGASFEDGVVKMLGIVGPVGNNSTTGVPFNERRAVEHLAAVARACDEADRVAEAVRRRMQLGP